MVESCAVFLFPHTCWVPWMCWCIAELLRGRYRILGLRAHDVLESSRSLLFDRMSSAVHSPLHSAFAANRILQVINETLTLWGLEGSGAKYFYFSVVIIYRIVSFF